MCTCVFLVVGVCVCVNRLVFPRVGVCMRVRRDWLIRVSVRSRIIGAPLAFSSMKWPMGVFVCMCTCVVGGYVRVAMAVSERVC